MMQLRDDIIRALEKKFEGEITAHKVNVEILLENTVGVGEHPNITETIEQELELVVCENALARERNLERIISKEKMLAKVR